MGEGRQRTRQPLATLGPRAAKSEAGVGRAEADPGRKQAVSTGAWKMAWERMLVS